MCQIEPLRTLSLIHYRFLTLRQRDQYPINKIPLACGWRVTHLVIHTSVLYFEPQSPFPCFCDLCRLGAFSRVQFLDLICLSPHTQTKLNHKHLVVLACLCKPSQNASSVQFLLCSSLPLKFPAAFICQFLIFLSLVHVWLFRD